MAIGGGRRIEFLDITTPQVDRATGVIRLTRAKQRGKRKGEIVDRIAITPRMGELLDRIAAVSRGDCLYLFPNKFNNAYTTEGFETLWQRCMLDAIKQGVVAASERFNFHALRHYFVTAHVQQYGNRPNLHSDERVTASVYDANTFIDRKAL